MKDIPLLFKAPMVRATRGGYKWQTRRVVKDVPAWVTDFGYTAFTPERSISARGTQPGNEKFIKCPYGKVGDKLWVRETWNKHGGVLTYRADGDWINEFKEEHDRNNPTAVAEASLLKWKPSIFMPRWASRITLEVLDIRVERLNDITQEDAKAEGIQPLPLQDPNDPSAWWEVEPSVCQARKPKESYALFWEKINGKGSWALNPWVWVISFKMLPQQ